MIDGENICPRTIRENILNVRTNQPLTLSLSVLNKNCDFKKAWEDTYNFEHEEEIKEEKNKKLFIKHKRWMESARGKAWKKEYYNRPEVKKKQKKWMKKHMASDKYKLGRERRAEIAREYRQRPEVKAKTKKYYDKPATKERVRKTGQKYYRKNREKILGKARIRRRKIKDGK